MENILCTDFSLRSLIMTKNKTKQNCKKLPSDSLTKKENNYTCSKIVGYFSHCFSRGSQGWRETRQNRRDKEQAIFQLHIQLRIHQKPRHYTEYTSTPWRNNGSCLLTFSKRVLEGSQILHLSD